MFGQKQLVSPSFFFRWSKKVVRLESHATRASTLHRDNKTYD